MKKAASNFNAESYPKTDPKLHLHEKPKLHSTGDQLAVTPEKPKVIKHVGMKSGVKKKVIFKENDEKLANHLSTVTLSEPVINSTNALKNEIGKVRTKKFDVSEDFLKEVSKNIPDEAVNAGLNYKRFDTKYKNLTSFFEVNDDAVPKSKLKSLYQPKETDEECKPHLMDLYNSEYFGNEGYFLDDTLDFKIEHYSDEEEEDNIEDKYAFLFDMYNYYKRPCPCCQEQDDKEHQ